MAIRFAVFGLNQGSKIARDAKKNPDYDLVAVAGFGQQAEDVQCGRKRVNAGRERAKVRHGAAEARRTAA